MTDMCPDGHRCENNALCVENPNDEGNYMCDCDPRIQGGVFEGLYCEHEATVFCSEKNTLTSPSFCTNGGTCKEQSDKHLGCDCPFGYEGDHCQFISGTNRPPRGFTLQIGTANSKLGGGAKFGVAFVVLVLVAVVGFFARRTLFGGKVGSVEGDVERGLRSPTKSRDEPQIDPDGGVLQDSLSASFSDANSPVKSFPVSPSENSRASVHNEDAEVL